MILFIFAAIFLVSNCQSVIREDQIAKIITLNETSFVTYNSTTSKCRIDCADADTMSLPTFRGLEKVWKFNGSAMFSADDKTFIDSNRSLEFQVLTEEDSGNYMCCTRDVQLAYQSYVCYSTQLVIVNEDALDAISSTEAPLPPAWNLIVEEGDEINCQPDSIYFLKVFDENVTDVKCLVNDVPVDIKMNNAFPSPIFNDVLIKHFNVSEHSGLYSCNATIHDGNETINEQVSFKISESWGENQHAVLLQEKMVRDALASSSPIPMHKVFIILLIVVAIITFQ
ncbi:unnamed protein product [Caenorhabditis angaria]|uniref:Ig-like domain-containing protein n=1 Tax=Caenorhabditis angaria TaxID=860376 RepID=A0A9P1MYS8_9PELO|nr:unnamed protein product [Caenorhabditis angaria]